MGDKKDHCSFWPDGKYGSCCKQHDECYSKGGDRHDRKKCDVELKECLSEKANPSMAWVMYIGVRIFGWLPHHFKRDLFMRKKK